MCIWFLTEVQPMITTERSQINGSNIVNLYVCGRVCMVLPALYCVRLCLARFFSMSDQQEANKIGQLLVFVLLFSRFDF